MSSLEPGSERCRPADATRARPLATVRGREHLVVTGTVRATRVVRSSGVSFEVDLADKTASVTLVFVGRVCVPGIGTGAELTVEGTILERSGRRLILNPCYRIDA